MNTARALRTPPWVVKEALMLFDEDYVAVFMSPSVDVQPGSETRPASIESSERTSQIGIRTADEDVDAFLASIYEIR